MHAVGLFLMNRPKYFLYVADWLFEFAILHARPFIFLLLKTDLLQTEYAKDVATDATVA